MSSSKQWDREREDPRVFVVSDTHFGHKGALKWGRRPWESVDEMDRALIRVWNEVVPENGIVLHLGDFSWVSPAVYLASLNGEISIMLGNHDKPKELRACVDSGLLKEYRHVLYYRWMGHRFWFSHYAHRFWLNSERGVFHGYGHNHGDAEDHGKSTDVGIDGEFCTLNGRPWAPTPLWMLVDYLKDRPNIFRHPE